MHGSRPVTNFAYHGTLQRQESNRRLPHNHPKRSRLKYTKKPYRVRIDNNTRLLPTQGRTHAVLIHA